MASPALGGLDAPTFDENTVNATPQVIDSDVTFTDADGDFNGGTLTVSGLLAQDRVSIQTAGLISYNSGAGQVSYNGTVIGTVSGGVGATFTVTFNADATAASIEALIEHLTYANVSDTPTASRPLYLQVTDAAGNQLTGTAAPAYTQLPDSQSPFAAMQFDLYGSGAGDFADLDNDGDQDFIVAPWSGGLRYFQNTGSTTSPVFTERTGGANPFNGLGTGERAVRLVDLDGDGDLDAVTGQYDSGNFNLFYYRNDGTAASPSFTQTSGAANPFDGFSPYNSASASFADLDNDGDLDALLGNQYFRNVGSATAPSFVEVTGAGNPFQLLNLGSDVTSLFRDFDRDGDMDLLTGDGDGLLRYFRNDGTASAPVFVRITGAANPFNGMLSNTGTHAAPTDVDIDGDGDVDIINIRYFGNFTLVRNDTPSGVQITVDVAAENDAHTLSGLTSSVTFAENTVNAAPQLLDSDVTFTDPDNGFNGGHLTVSGALAEDTVGIRNQGTGAGQIGVSGANVTYGGVTIGTFIGGAGATLNVTFNAGATAAAIDALIQNLTYANASDTPTASRTLTLNVSDANGHDLGSGPSFVAETGASDPFDGVSWGLMGSPAFTDIDGDGDADLVLAEVNGYIGAWRNGTVGAPGAFTFLSGGDNPFEGVTLSTSGFVKIAIGDIDSDGDDDLVLGDADSSGAGNLNVWRNGTNGAAGAYVQLTGSDNPFNGFTANFSAPALGDFDGDGDLDLVSGSSGGGLKAWRNGTDGASGAFTELTGGANPFNGISPGSMPTPTFVDIDSDGDVDLVVGNLAGTIRVWRNGTNGADGAFAELTGADNPFLSVSNSYTAPVFADVDGDGDFDLAVGTYLNDIYFMRNTTQQGVSLAITVTAEADGIIGTSAPDTLAGTGAADNMDGGDGDDTLDGGVGDDIMVGGTGADYLKGGTGADAMSGGTGNDTYIVDNAGDATDETGGDGTDLVRANITWTIGSAIENLDLLSGGGAISGTGNSLDNVLNGNSYDNTLNGLDGADTLNGGGGNDVLNGGAGGDFLYGGNGDDQMSGGDDNDLVDGGAGNDRLDGGGGADSMAGGIGNDVYVVDDAGDTVTEAAAGGTDTVEASVYFGLGANVENLTLTGSADISGDGNAMRNTITGNSGANVLNGGAEIDTLSGMAGTDVLFGGSGNDILLGGDGQDWLQGGDGSDRLSGEAGGDRFQFTNDDVRRSGLGQTPEKDKIVDLNFADGDWIDLSAIDANALTGGVDDAFAFVSKFTRVAGQAVLSYSAGTGLTTLELDIDGDGKADFRVEINGDQRGTTANLYTGGGDANGGWVL